MAGGAVIFLLYALVHGSLGISQLERQFRVHPNANTTEATCVRSGNIFFSFALVCNNLQLFCAGISPAGNASRNLFYVLDAVHLICLPIYVPMAVEFAKQARLEGCKSTFLPAITFGVWLSCLGFMAFGCAQYVYTIQNGVALSEDRQLFKTELP